jgi:nucleoporin NUP82
MAAAELFRRIEVLQTELRQQISKANEVAARVEAVTGDDVKDGPVEGENERIVLRIEKARETQKKLAERLNKVKQKIGKGGRRELSERESLWLEEVHAAARNILPPSEIPAISSTELDIPKTSKDVTLPWQRFEQAEDLYSSLMSQYRDLLRDIEGTQSPLSSSNGNIGERGLRVPKDVRKQKLDQITKLLERESALVEGAKTRLEKLSLGA